VDIAQALNLRGIKTNRGSQFTPTHINRLLKAAEISTAMRETIRNRESGVVGYRETGSGNREILRDKSGQMLGRYETDTKVTRDVHGTITGRGSNQLLRLLK